VLWAALGRKRRRIRRNTLVGGVLGLLVFPLFLLLKPDFLSGNAAQNIRRGNALFAKGLYDDALYAFDEAIRLDPHQAAAYRGRGSVYLARERYSMAVKELNEAIRLDPSSVEALLARARARMGNGAKERAAADHRTALALDPNQSEAISFLALHLHSTGKFAEAIRMLDQAIARGSAPAVLYRARGDVLRLTGAYDQAIVNYNEALRSAPKDALTYFGRGDAFRAKGQYACAIDALDQFLRTRPSDVDALASRGIAHHNRGSFEPAIDDYNKVLQLDQNRTVIWQNRGIARAMLQKWDAAHDDFARAVKLKPDDPSIWYDYAYLRLKSSSAFRYRETCAELLGRFGKTTDPNVASTVAFLCTLIPAAMEDPKAVVALARRAVSSDPKSKRFPGVLGAALYRSGHHAEAVPLLEESIRRHAEGGLVVDWLFLAMAHYRLGHADEAKKCLAGVKTPLERIRGTRPGDTTIRWQEVVILPLLAREVEQLLRGGS